MSRTEHFPAPGPVELHVRNATGSVDVVSTDTGTTTVELTGLENNEQVRDRIERARVEASGDGRRVVVDVPDRKGLTSLGRHLRVAVHVAVPADSELRLHTASATVSATGRYAGAEVHAASGTIRLGEVTGYAHVEVASGDIEIASCGGGKVQAASGSLGVGRASDRLAVQTASGDVSIGVAESSLLVRTASGRVTIEEAASGRIELNTASGDQTIGVRRGVTAKLDLVSPGGRVRSELPVEDVAPEGGAALEIRARAASGRVLVRPAVPVAG